MFVREPKPEPWEMTTFTHCYFVVFRHGNTWRVKLYTADHAELTYKSVLGRIEAGTYGQLLAYGYELGRGNTEPKIISSEVLHTLNPGEIARRMGGMNDE